ncbi:MAG: class II fructose-bisphosphate aldolase [bacterium]|nr:class II fructose-bisphosphate aldolase [bacterium]
MKSLKEYILKAERDRVAIGHFNFSNIETFWAIVNAARELEKPVILGASEGERDFVGVKQCVALAQSLRAEGLPVFLNADHTYSVERVKEAIDAGFDAVIYDGAKLSTEENIANAKVCVDYARASGKNVLVEAELGYIGMSSKVLDAIPEGVSLENLTTPEEAKRFVEETGVDLFAPSVGNIHGMLRNVPDPRLNIERVGEIHEATGKPLVLHGGSGTNDDDFRKAIKNGVAIVHISTEIRVAYRDALKKFLNENPDEVAPYKIMKSVVEAEKEVVKNQMMLFSNP